MVGAGEIPTMATAAGGGVAILTPVGAITHGDILDMDMATTTMAEIITVATAIV